MHARADGGDRIRRVDEHCRMQEQLVDPRAQQRGEARRLLLARDGVELAGDVEIKERGEARVLVDEPQGDVARHQVAQRFLARDESIGAVALHDGAGVERIPGAAQRNEIVAVAFLDRALDDDVQAVGRAVAGR